MQKLVEEGMMYSLSILTIKVAINWRVHDIFWLCATRLSVFKRLDSLAQVPNDCKLLCCFGEIRASCTRVSPALHRCPWISSCKMIGTWLKLIGEVRAQVERGRA